MRIFERNALLKKYVSRAPNVTVKTNTKVQHIVKTNEGFNVSYQNEFSYTDSFDHVILTAWDQTQTILDESATDESAKGASVKDESAKACIKDKNPEIFSVEDRVIALCDISKVPLSMRDPFYTMTEGAMFVPLDRDTGIIYRCSEGASYPEKGRKEIALDHVVNHAETIIKEFKELIRKDSKSLQPFDNVECLGGRIQKIVRRLDSDIAKRHYEPPYKTPEGIIISMPLKATFIGSSALQAIEMLLKQLKKCYSNFTEKWCKKIEEIVPYAESITNSESITDLEIVCDFKCLYSGENLPDEFLIKGVGKINKRDILDETVLYISCCNLNQKGKEVLQFYKNKQPECSSPPSLSRRKTLNFFPAPSPSPSPLPMQRSSSDTSRLVHSPSYIELKTYKSPNTNHIKKTKLNG